MHKPKQRPKGREHEIVIPDAAPVIQSLRSIGYIPETAVADLIDNCLDAKADRISVTMLWDAERSYIRIEDNGSGMDEKTLVQAMRLGSKDPTAKRKAKELGRFGMGLKTASFSLGKRLTVLTKQAGRVFVRCWDLDVIQETNEWRLRRQAYEESKDRLGTVAGSSGTIVFIEKLDRLRHKQNRFYSQVTAISKHLELVFHRFLEAPNATAILLNGNSLRAWDPFCTKLERTEEMGSETLPVSGNVNVAGYILPHHSRLTKEQYAEASGPNGWFDQQGFYIYRNRRLLLAGGWLGTFPKEEPSKLARVRVDIEQDADFDWQIDVKKSVARPPHEVAEHLKRWAEQARLRSYKAFYHRSTPRKPGAVISGTTEDLDFLWEQGIRANRPHFMIHQGNPLLQRIRASCSDEVRSLLDGYLKMLQELNPANTMSFAPPPPQEQPEIEPSHVAEIERLANVYRAMDIGLEEAIRSLKSMPVFAPYAAAAIRKVIEGGGNK